VQTGVLFAQLGSRGTHTCAVQANTGVGYCRGDNLFGQVGDATTTSPRLPRRKTAEAGDGAVTRHTLLGARRIVLTVQLDSASCAPEPSAPRTRLDPVVPRLESLPPASRET
jgi:hypothetical protein